MSLSIEDRADGAVLRVRAAPGASRDRIVGMHGDALKIAVTVPPEKGKANERLLTVLGTGLGIAPKALRVVAGATARDKLVLVTGWTASTLRDRLEALLASDPRGT